MRKIFAFILSMALLQAGLTACAAENSASEGISIVLQIGNPVMMINGTEKPIDDGGTSPVIIDDRTLLPVRAVIEEMGGAVHWDGDTQTVLLAYNGDIITLAIDNTTAFFNDYAQELDAAPAIIADRTMLPIRFIAESFKFGVDWVEAEQKVIITRAN